MKARIPKNMGGGAQNMNSMIKQAQKMQDQITELQEDIEARDFSATAGGGAVEVVLTGKKTIKSLTLKPEVVDPGGNLWNFPFQRARQRFFRQGFEGGLSAVCPQEPSFCRRVQP